MPKQKTNRHAGAIETLLLWEGRVTRARLVELFDMHATHASRAIASFREAYPRACTHDLPSKSYLASPILKPKLTAGDFASYQRLVGAMGRASVVAAVPVESALMDATHIGYALFREIHRALREGRALRITYRSLTTPAAHERVVRPHALIQAGVRWHVRAWCNRAGGFRDFNLGRIRAAVPVDDQLPGPDADCDWETMVKVRLVPHRGLSKMQAELVREEYMAGTTAIVHTVRVPLVRYLIQAFRAAVDPASQPAPEHLLMIDDPRSLPPNAVW